MVFVLKIDVVKALLRSDHLSISGLKVLVMEQKDVITSLAFRLRKTLASPKPSIHLEGTRNTTAVAVKYL